MKQRIFAVLIITATVFFSLISAKEHITPESKNALLLTPEYEKTLVIDAGHGGEDGGAVSPSGAVESHINLSIALRLDKILGLYGIEPVLLRETDISLHDSNAKTLREKKVSDLKNRVSMIESLNNPTLISIHQNTYTSNQYHGAQVFYTNEDLSLEFAQITQGILREFLDPENNRQASKVPESVYLMNHISCQAILVECGFLSNLNEEVLLQTDEYQTKIAAALTGSYLKLQQTDEEGESLSVS